MINTSDVFTQKTREKHNFKKIAVKRSDFLWINEYFSVNVQNQLLSNGRFCTSPEMNQEGQ